MIEITDIRTGNYVYQIVWGTIEKVEAVVVDPTGDPELSELVIENKHGNQEAFLLDEFFPVAILPDLVERMGFVRSLHVYPDGSTIKGWQAVSNDRFLLTRDLVTWYLEDISMDVPRYINKELSYLHELQNLYFALTGEELTLRS